MRICDWSSDVCSADLVADGQGLVTLKKFAVVGEDGFGLFGAVAIADAAEDDDVLRSRDRTVAAILFGDRDRRVLRDGGGGRQRSGKGESGDGMQAERANHFIYPLYGCRASRGGV